MSEKQEHRRKKNRKEEKNNISFEAGQLLTQANRRTKEEEKKTRSKGTLEKGEYPQTEKYNKGKNHGSGRGKEEGWWGG